MLADSATASLKAGRSLDQRSPRLKEPRWSAALAGITNYTAHRLGQPSPSWTRRIKPLDEPWIQAESYRSVRELTAAQIRALLHEHGWRLQVRGVHGDIKLVGGAALVLQRIGNRPGADIDASYANQATVYPSSQKWPQTATAPPTGSIPTQQPLPRTTPPGWN